MTKTAIVRRGETPPQMGVVPRTMEDLDQLARACVASGFFADAKQAGQALIKIQAGAELGLPPVQSMTNINVIKGRITLSAGLMAALLKRSGYKLRVRWTEDPLCCTIAVYEGGELVGESSFSIQDAKRAGLAGANWQKYPRNMLYARAVSNAARWYAPEVLTGCYLPDELEGAPDDLRPAQPVETYTRTDERVTPRDQTPAPSRPTRPTPTPTTEPALPLPDPDAHPGEGWQAANRRLRAVMRDGCGEHGPVTNEEMRAVIRHHCGEDSSRKLKADQLLDISYAIEHMPSRDPMEWAAQFATLLQDGDPQSIVDEIRADLCDHPWKTITLERVLAGGEG